MLFFIALSLPVGEISNMTTMRMIIFILLLSFCGCAVAGPVFTVGIGGDLVNLSGGDAPRFVIGPAYRINFGANLSPEWMAQITIGGYKLHNDTRATSLFTFGSDENYRTQDRKATDISLLLRRNIYHVYDKLVTYGALGGGVSIWKLLDPSTDEILQTTAETGGQTDISVSEINLSAGFGTDYSLTKNLKLGLLATINYLTGTGQEFASAYKDSLSDWKYSLGLNLSFCFGGGSGSKPARPKLTSTQILSTPVAAANTVGSGSGGSLSGRVDKDSDHDGVPDLYDLCPDTDRDAAGLVDLNGCPVDADFDGIPDYKDACPNNPAGAIVDSRGCPVDSDGDGVPDGIDNCPDTRPDMKVDAFGCVDLTALSKPMVLHIKYDPGSFEVDHDAKARLDELAKLLKAARGVRVEINGYTDNIGLPEDNKALSEKRARRVRDYLISLGIDGSRLTAVGRGETNFVASNNTQEGRQQNRRVELIFAR